MTVDFSRDKPIYTQLVEKICGDIIRGNRRLGDKMPSVREYALEVGVNVNTVQRVYKELEQMELTETKRGQGTYITNDRNKVDHLREQMKEKIVEQFFHSIEEFGFTKKEIMEQLQKQGEENK
ncbi:MULTISPECIES: GntR family transcriptional regulator [unclassified Rummeliibacillus]|uniref:GntR family transcriptional regulator n=1 Tax=unclassified Rummeliibacillus TaxID=2622809 RepID=UPI000E669BAA|nr:MULTISPECIES: GntR family transcriptional regulator [unclassified Rummeliibacillus]RIJ65757.1 GntR family transcriptional regulator [Rummeliibacillus sp. POC4]RPJ95697.1 GntR family transcriptional regulator [Rummeliibacillus sp. TYF005]